MDRSRRGKKILRKDSMFLVSLLLLAGTLLFGQTSPVVAQESNLGYEAPINPQFTKYLGDIQLSKTKSMKTEGNYKLGFNTFTY